MFLEQAAKEKELFSNQAIWEAGEFLKSSLTSADIKQPIDIKNQLNAINKLGGTKKIIFLLGHYDSEK